VFWCLYICIYVDESSIFRLYVHQRAPGPGSGTHIPEYICTCTCIILCVCVCVCVCAREREREERERERGRERERERVCVFLCMHMCVYVDESSTFRSHIHPTDRSYGVATVSRIDKIIGLFCRISALL